MSGEFNTEVASVMIRQALEDLEATENKKYFEVDMGNWVSVQNKYLAEPKPLKLGPLEAEVTRICKVCFAGSVMSNRLADTIMSMTPDDFDKTTRDCLFALEDLRSYGYYNFADYFYQKSHKFNEKITAELIQLNLNRVTYEENAQQFKENMNKIADKLEELGL